MDTSGKLGIFLKTVDVLAVAIFTFEMVVRMGAYGIIKPVRNLPPGSPGPYFGVGWNWMDFCAVVTASLDFIISVTATSSSDLKIVRAMRVIRVLRPLKLIKTYHGVRIIVESFLRSVPTLVNLILISLLFYLGFGILFVNLLKGSLWYCSLDPRGNTFLHIENREQCQQSGGEWLNSPSNFDHIGHSMLTLLQMSTGEGWLDMMSRIVDSRGIDLQPRRYARIHLVIPLVGFISLSNFFILNLFIGVLVDHFMLSKAEFNKVELIDAANRLWLEMQRSVFLNPQLVARFQNKRVRAPLASGGVRKCILRVVGFPGFDAVVLLAILANTVLLCVNHPAQSTSFQDSAEIWSSVFLGIFNLEALLKCIAYGKGYFKDNWNIFDLCSVIGSDVGVVVNIITSGEGLLAQVLRGLRVIRVLRLARYVSFLRLMVETLSGVIPGLINVSLLVGLMTFMYAIVGVGLFGTIADGTALVENANFHSFGMALLTLLRTATGEQWHLLMHELVSDQPGCTREPQTREQLLRDGPRGCGTVLAYPFFITFQVIVCMIVSNMIIAVVIGGFHGVQQQDELNLFRKEVAQLMREWRMVDKPWTGYLELQKVVDILIRIPPPLGFRGSKRKHVLHKLRLLRLYQGTKVHIRDIMMICAQRAYLWLREEPEADTERVHFDQDTLVRWIATFRDVPYADIYAGNSVLVAHVIIATHVMRFVKKKRHEWKLAKFDRQKKAAAEEREREEAKQRPVAHLTIDTGDGSVPPDTGAGVGDLGVEDTAKPKGPEPLPTALQEWDPKAAATPSVLVTQLAGPSELEMPQLSPLPWPPPLTPSRR